MNWYLEALKKYAVFSGRARRKEYWFFFLFNIILTIVASILDTVIFGTAIGGWFLFITLIPIIGGIWLLVLMCRDGEPAENQYGANPKVA